MVRDVTSNNPLAMCLSTLAWLMNMLAIALALPWFIGETYH